MNILIATPTYGGLGAEYVASIMRLQSALTAQGVASRCTFNAMAEVVRSRNTLATHFWENDEFTHLLFVDSDIGFEPDAVGALVRARKPLVGAAYPKRKLDLERLIASARKHADSKSAIAAALDWVVVPAAGEANIEDGRCKVAGLGMGLCLIQREVFAQLLATGRVSRDPRPGSSLHKGPLLGFFDPVIGDDGVLAEDISFCQRWREWCGGEVWAVLDQEISHVGTMVFRGRCLDALATGAPKP